jgi:DinB superfamily
MEERIVKADPVAQPQEYQKELLALLGGQDPMTVLTATPQALREQAGGLPDELLERRPEPDEWSVVELLGHLWDAEIAYAFRARLILAQDGPPLIGYDQDAWAKLARPRFADLLAAYTALRGANLVLATQTPEPLWSRSGIHSERGPTSFRLLTETMAGHDRAHLEQLRRTIAQVHT